MLPVFCLVALGILLGYIASVSLELYAGAEVDSEKQQAYMNLCVVTIVSLGITLLLLMWAVIRWIRLFRSPPVNSRPLEYVDAWSAAGKRIELEGHDREADGDDL